MASASAGTVFSPASESLTGSFAVGTTAGFAVLFSGGFLKKEKTMDWNTDLCKKNQAVLLTHPTAARQFIGQ
ncbi:hypothetical protein [Propionivibrio limicola]|uniref:hypothetical protein n=1 Tax=Propionivibrio limicola TaxID=167645 RepID=UPI00129211AD|nr:hypothetical protein [Propionivibrio limicola]